MKPIKIVICDDHDLLRVGLRSRLADVSDFEVVAEGASGEEAIALFKQHRPDILLSDVAMPKKNGLEAASEILADDADAKIVFLSVYDDPEYVTEAMRIGAKGFVLKDVERQEMYKAIKRVATGGTYFAGRALKTLEERQPCVDLTAREREVLREIAKGQTNKEIAYTLDLSVRTVESHRSSIRQKSGGGNAAALARLAQDLGLG